MTSTRQDKPASPAAVEPDATVELNDAALDQAAGGSVSNSQLIGIDFRPTASGFYGSGVYKTTDGGRDG